MKAWDDTVRELWASTAIPHPLYRILLYGPPRTGKSSIPRDLVGANHERVTIHKQLPTEDLLGGWTLVDGKTVWQDGPAIRALRGGKILVLDEIDQLSPETRCIGHALLDDPPGITLASGERVVGTKGYCVIATTNALPSALSPAILDRFDLILLANTLSNGLKSALGELASPAEAVTSRDKSYAWTRPASVNFYLTIAKLRKKGMKDTEAIAALGLYGQQAKDALLSLTSAASRS